MRKMLRNCKKSGKKCFIFVRNFSFSLRFLAKWFFVVEKIEKKIPDRSHEVEFWCLFTFWMIENWQNSHLKLRFRFGRGFKLNVNDWSRQPMSSFSFFLPQTENAFSASHLTDSFYPRPKPPANKLPKKKNNHFLRLCCHQYFIVFTVPVHNLRLYCPMIIVHSHLNALKSMTTLSTRSFLNDDNDGAKWWWWKRRESEKEIKCIFSSDFDMRIWFSVFSYLQRFRNKIKTLLSNCKWYF